MNELKFSSLSDSQGFGSHTVTDANALGLSNPDSMLAGQLRGTQNVGSSGAQIDAANNRITLTNPATGSVVGIGAIPGSTTGEFGFFSQDSSGNLIFKIVGATFYVYDATTSKNAIQMGKLPDSSYGFAAAVTGSNVSEGF